MLLPQAISDRLQKRYHELLADGELLPKENLQAHYKTFQARFGPEVLSRLDGEELLEIIHNHGNRNSLVYWLEFKNDEELPAEFGSIAGGSALKFGIYRRKETGSWMTGSPKDQKELTVEEAIEVAHKHRDQLIRGLELLQALPTEAEFEDYRRLQEAMDKEAPAVSNLAWGHKYFSLMHPEKLDDYHSPSYQQFHLVKMLQMPPAGDGRYLPAYQFVQIGRELWTFPSTT
jgi:5-methylcytosine-specific restriction protein B